MREIKFRALVRFGQSDKYFWLNYTPKSRHSEFHVVTDIKVEDLQYTGLKDKKGVEIYEGDIVSYKTFYYGNEKDHKKEVKWDQWTSDDFGQPDCVGYFNIDSTMEVIGNIYQNP